MLLAACAAPTAPPTRTVRIEGTHADSLGRTIGSEEGGTLRVQLHEGPILRVDARSVRDLVLEPGSFVAVGSEGGAIRVLRVIEGLDRLLLVEGAGAREIVPVNRVIAVLRAEPSLTPPPPVAPPPPPSPPPPPAPPPDPRRFATVSSGTELLERVRVASCDARGARVLGRDGLVTTVPLRALRAVRLSAGDRVYALWDGGDTAYAATVVAIADGLVSLSYDDGDTQTTTADQIVRVEAAPGRALTSCPRGHSMPMIRRGALRRTVEVISCGNTEALVRASEADPPRTVPLAELRALAVPPGAHVEALWHESAPYPAIAGLTDGDTIQLTYEDGSVEGAHVTHVRWIAADLLPEPYVCVSPDA